MKNVLAFLFVGLLAANLLLQSCAQMASPPGGKKDTLAPKILNSSPLHKSKNFKGKKIELVFNEYINVRNLNQELLITPNVGTYQTKLKPTGLALQLDSALKENTTYTFNFRNAIEDMSERNIGKNIKLVFSTSQNIDSLVIQGKVKSLQQNMALENVLVALYPFSDTLRIDKTKPYYFTKSDTSGIYVLENVAAGKYYMAAFQDLNNNLLYNSSKEPVDFISEPFLTLSKNEKQNFNIALQNQDPLKIAKTTSTAKTVLYDFNRGIKEIKFDKDPKLSIAYQIENAHSLRFYAQKLEKKDTLFITALIKDSVNRDYKIPLKIKFRELTTKEKPSKSTMPLSILPTSGKYLSPEDSLLIILPKPVVAWDSKRIQFITGPDELVLLPDEAYSWNDVSNRLRIDRAYLPLREKFDLSIEKGAFVGIENDTSDAFRQTFQFQDLEQYGIMEGGIKDVTGKFIFQLISTVNNLIAYEQISNGKFSFLHVEPGQYIVRVIHDKNQNGYWDIGNFITKTKPEPIYYLPGKIKLKANFQLTDLWISPE
jgi:uncharacterized protein (DUF2141 family)